MKLKHLPMLALIASTPSVAEPPVFGRYHDDLATVVLYEKASPECNAIFHVPAYFPDEPWFIATVTREGEQNASYCWHDRGNGRFLVCPPDVTRIGACFNLPLALLNLKS
jgi:hypothetical protein